MANPAKKIPDAKSAKTVPDATEGVAKPKSKKLVLIGIGVFILLVAIGAGWYFTKGSSSGSHVEAPKPKQNPGQAPKFIKLDTFTVNLRHGEGEEERVLQTVINLQIQDAELEEKIKMFMPKIYNNTLILLSKKRASELSTAEGKQQLAKEIKAEAEIALGLRTAPALPPNPTTHESNAASGVETASQVAPASAESAPMAAQGGENNSGIVDVLFTSFIIQ